MSAVPLTVRRERDGKLLRLRLARPKANIIDAEMIAALDAALEANLTDHALLGVLIDHEGPHFSFGASVQEHLPGQFPQMLRSFFGLIRRMIEADVPILAAVRGQCLGGGMEVAIASNLIFAAPDAKFGQPEIQLGVFAPPASAILPERIPRGAAESVLFSGKPIDGNEAYRLGLVHAVSADPEAAALAYFDESLAPHSPAALRFAVRAARLDYVERVTAKFARLEALYVTELMSTRDALEGLTAFVEKRPAIWEGR
ncbi:MAG: cyclohexa-1,5-dienecarbonyl-CoA hydratase [Candidatus Velthaea sp.]|jgi:cyclohexa-1,5-dienecarbonyl-CoA hydratase